MSARAVGLVIALSVEARALTGRAQPVARVVEVADGVVLRVGGTGARAAERSCAALVEAGAGAVLSLGCAAGLAPQCRPGALVVPSEVRTAQGEILATDTEWRAALLAALGNGFSPFAGAIVSVDQIMGSAQKRELHARTAAVAADMESAAVARVAQRCGLPMLALRAVSDGAEDDVPPAVLDAIDEFGRPRYRALLGALVRSPGDLAALKRLRTGFGKACNTLSRVAATTGLGFCFPKADRIRVTRPPCPPPR